MSTILCECGCVLHVVRNGVHVIWDNGAVQLADRYKCQRCGSVVYTGFGGHIGHLIKDKSNLTPRFVVETGEYVE